MNLEEDILIERFLRDSLSDHEREEFLERMKSEDAFRERVNLEKKIFQSLNENEWNFIETKNKEILDYEDIYKSKDITELKKVIRNVNAEYQSKRIPAKRKMLVYLSAAVIALLITLYLMLPNSTAGSQELYTIYIEKTELTSFVSRDVEQKNNLIEAQQLFENNEFKKALALFNNEMSSSNEQNSNVYIYVGLSQLELNMFDQAEATFNSLITSSLIDAQKGYWFQALASLKANKIQKSKNLLENIIKNKLYNYKEAENLLKELS